MKKPSLVLFDWANEVVVKAQDPDGQWWVLQGSCLRCGKCCPKNCKSLGWETLDGKKQAVCEAQWAKPWMCKVWPHDPNENLLEGCGYHWVRE